jgi:SAM-dependent methyltransferase
MLPYIFLIFHLFFALTIFFLVISFVTGAPFVPSNTKASDMMVKFACIKKGMKIYDLGCGDGRLLFLTAQKGAQAIGFEINPFLVLYTFVRKMHMKEHSSITVLWKNFWNADIHDADAVFVYLLPWKMEKLEQKLLRELKPGARVVSNSFIFPHLELVNEDKTTHIFEFRIPKRLSKKV